MWNLCADVELCASVYTCTHEHCIQKKKRGKCITVQQWRLRGDAHAWDSRKLSSIRNTFTLCGVILFCRLHMYVMTMYVYMCSQQNKMFAVQCESIPNRTKFSNVFHTRAFLLNLHLSCSVIHFVPHVQCTHMYVHTHNSTPTHTILLLVYYII